MNRKRIALIITFFASVLALDFELMAEEILYKEAVPTQSNTHHFHLRGTHLE